MILRKWFARARRGSAPAPASRSWSKRQARRLLMRLLLARAHPLPIDYCCFILIVLGIKAGQFIAFLQGPNLYLLYLTVLGAVRCVLERLERRKHSPFYGSRT